MWLAIVIAALAAYLLGNHNGAVCVSVWMVHDDVRTHGSGNAGLTNFLRSYGGSKTLLVVALDETGSRRISWRLKDALPIGYEISPMDALRTEVLTESITFQITGVERILEPAET